MIKVLNERCICCEKCVRHCPSGIISINENKACITDFENCLECGHCQAVCNSNAIILNDILEENENARQNVTYEDLKDLIKSNRSIRKFKDCLVEKDKIKDILRTLDYTASAKNEQPVKWIVVSGKEKVDEISNLAINFVKNNNLDPELLNFIKSVRNPITVDAPHLLIAYANKNSVKPYDDCMIKMSLASTLMHSCGIGSCYLGYLSGFINVCPELKAYLNLEKTHRVFSAIGFGYNDNEIYSKIPTRKNADIRFI